jgi:hypothetical protein
MQTTYRRTFAAVAIAAACIAALGLITLTAAETSTVASNYVFDGTWPKLPLPNKWTFGGVQALAIDKDDVLWVSHRPNDLNETENFASLNPPQAECCVKGPAILAFDREGNLVHSFDTMPGHVILIDAKAQLWVGHFPHLHQRRETRVGDAAFAANHRARGRAGAGDSAGSRNDCWRCGRRIV